jgi:hypothetical protein
LSWAARVAVAARANIDGANIDGTISSPGHKRRAQEAN